jgi:hypothetical protein
MAAVYSPDSRPLPGLARGPPVASFERMFDNIEMLHAAALSPDLLERLRSVGVGTGVATGDDALLPVPQALAGLFPEGGLRRGSTITVSGSSSLVLALLGEVSKRPGWCAEVGSPLFGSAAAAEAGVALERFIRVASPGEQWPSVVASLLEAFDVVVVHPPARLLDADMRRLTARARERSAVLLVAADAHTSAWPGADAHTSAWPGAMLGLSVIAQQWHGLGSGHGYLRARELEVQALGRGAAALPRRAKVWLPALDGAIAPVRSSAA